MREGEAVSKRQEETKTDKARQKKTKKDESKIQQQSIMTNGIAGLYLPGKK